MLLSLFTAFHGRISRKQWWIGFPIVALISVAGEIYLNPGILAEEGRHQYGQRLFGMRSGSSRSQRSW
jgi:uncharacterized membrane protein YhaH (DUF805 family)